MNGRDKKPGSWGAEGTPGRLPSPSHGTPPPPGHPGFATPGRSSDVLAVATTPVPPSTPPYSTDEQGLLRAGTVLGKYQIVRPLGAGGMGAVYEAIHTGIGKSVALKTMNAALASDPRAEQRFLREAAASSRLEHPHVVDVTDFGSDLGIIYIVMELMRGEDLAALIARAPAGLDYTFVVDVMLPVCAGVFAAHGQGVIHRDLKPQNIFLARTALGDFVPKVLDFGISKLIDEKGSTALTNSGSVMGTTHYLSPEQVTGQPVDARSDEFALGVILYECLTGRRPHDGETIFTIMRSISEGKFARPLALRPDLPPPLEAVVLRALAMRPDDRYPNVHALGRALLPFASPKGRMMWAEYFERGSAGPAAGTVLGAPSPHGGTWMGHQTPVAPTARGRMGSGETRSGVRPVSVMGTNEFQRRGSRLRRMAILVMVAAGGIAVWMILGQRKPLAPRNGSTGQAPAASVADKPAVPPPSPDPSVPAPVQARPQAPAEQPRKYPGEVHILPPTPTEAPAAPEPDIVEETPRRPPVRPPATATPSGATSRPRPTYGYGSRAPAPKVTPAAPAAKKKVRRVPLETAPPPPPVRKPRQPDDPIDDGQRLTPGGAPIID